MLMKLKRRRALVVLLSIVVSMVLVGMSIGPVTTQRTEETDAAIQGSETTTAVSVLESLEVKGRAPKTGYDRSEFGSGWQTVSGCDVRNIILYRDLIDAQLGDECTVRQGTLNDPYTGTTIQFTRGVRSDEVQVDHVVALSDAWQKGAQQLTRQQRIQFANDPLELIAVSGNANQQKGDGDAATWLPSNTSFRCQYVARQVTIKKKYNLWVTESEKNAIHTVLSDCPLEPVTPQ